MYDTYSQNTTVFPVSYIIGITTYIYLTNSCTMYYKNTLETH